MALDVPNVARVTFLTCAAVCMSIPNVNSFLDSTLPIVISLKDGTENYFGYSLAFKKGQWGGSPQTSGGTLFIGAPNATQYTKNTGVVWQCQFSPESGKLGCSLLSALSQQDSGQHFCSRYDLGKSHPEKESDQRIGFSLNVQNDQLIVGAPRWKLNRWKIPNKAKCSSEAYLIGAVYNVSSATRFSPVVNPFNEPVNRWHNGHLSNSDFGFTTAITPNNGLLVGAPSFGVGVGAVVELLGKQKTSIYKSIKIRNSLQYGYTLASGRTRHGIYQAFAAPRGKFQDLRGMVVIKHAKSNSTDAIYKGEQVGSYFGYALATVDINGDGYDELLVGSPGLTQPLRQNSQQSNWCLHIFNGATITNNKTVSQKLCVSPQISGLSKWTLARFGSAICNLGDINADSYEDFAVSAPYTDGGIGTLFVFYGGRSLPQNPAHIIHGKSLAIPNLHGLGTFLLGGKNVDVDGNGTPDFVMGAGESNYVVVIRTRPIATASLKLTFHATENGGLSTRILEVLPTQKNFQVRICVKFHYLNSVKLPDNSNPMLETWLSLEADTIHKRVEFMGNRQTIEFKQLLSSKQETCLNKTVYVLDKEEYSDPLQFRAGLWYNETSILSGQVAAKPTILEISGSQDHSIQNIYGNFKPYHPAPIPLIQGQWASLKLKVDNCHSDGNKACDSQLEFKSGPKITASGTLTVGQLKSITIFMEIINYKETAYNVTFRVNWTVSNNLEVDHDSMTFVWREISSGNDRCKLRKESGLQTNWSSKAQCSKLLHNATQVGVQLEIGGLANWKVNGPEPQGTVNFSVEAFPEKDEHTKKITKTLQLVLKNDAQIVVKSVNTVRAEVNRTGNSLIDVSQMYLLENVGASGTSANTVKAEVMVPYGILIVDPSADNNIQCTSKNFQFFNASSQTDSINMTSAEETLTFPLSISISDTYLMIHECSEKTQATCQKIECLMDLPSSTSKEMRIQMFLQETAIERFITDDIAGVRIPSSISVYFSGKFIQRVDGMSQREFRLLPGIPAWYFLAAGAGGLFLLILVTTSLVKCGFFERTAKQKLQVLKRQTMQMEHVNWDALMALHEYESEDKTDRLLY